MGTYYAPPIGRTGRSVCPYFAFLPASLRCLFSASFFGRGAPLFSVPVSLHSWQGRAAFFGSRLMVETHRFLTKFNFYFFSCSLHLENTPCFSFFQASLLFEPADKLSFRLFRYSVLRRQNLEKF